MLDSLSLRERQAIDDLSALHAEPEWLHRHRLKAWRLYQDMPLPTGQEEEWRRIDVDALSLDGLRLFEPDASPVAASPDGDLRRRAGYGGEIRQHDGSVVSQWLAPEIAKQGVVFSDLHTAARLHPALVRRCFMTEAVQPTAWKYVALHAALWRGGAFLYVPAGVEVALPLRNVVSVGAGSAVFPHTLIVAESGSSVTLVEEYASPQGRRASLSSGVVEILVRDGARVRYLGLESWGRNVSSFSTLRAVLGADSDLELGLVGLGGRLIKADVDVTLGSPGARAGIVGLFFGDGQQRLDYSTVEDHQAPHTTSDLLFKSALKDSAQLAWHGLTRIRRGADDSDSNQTSRNLLLSSDARVTPIPVLEIEAHDVKRCSHGATVSSVDEDQLYYMMSRGLSREEASRAIVEGFFQQGIELLPGCRQDDRQDGLRRQIGRALKRKLLARPLHRRNARSGDTEDV
jgi:Fe-S cluster assembly protein SufD